MEKVQEKEQKEREEQNRFERFAREWPQASLAVFLREIEIRCHTVAKTLIMQSNESAAKAYEQ
eukprot:12430910-Karenia_brevis.AAC.1